MTKQNQMDKVAVQHTCTTYRRAGPGIWGHGAMHAPLEEQRRHPVALFKLSDLGTDGDDLACAIRKRDYGQLVWVRISALGKRCQQCAPMEMTDGAAYLRDDQISVVKRCGIELDEDFSLADLRDLDFMKFEAIESLVVTGHDPLLRSGGCHIDFVGRAGMVSMKEIKLLRQHVLWYPPAPREV